MTEVAIPANINLSGLNLGNLNLNGFTGTTSSFEPIVPTSPIGPIGTNNLGNLNLNGLNNVNLNEIVQLTANDYSRLEHRDQIYKEPDTYLGSIDKNARVARVLNFGNPSATNEYNPKFEDIETEYPPGCERLFLEILYNATDNVVESRS